MQTEQFQWHVHTGWDRPLAARTGAPAQLALLFAATDVVTRPGWLAEVRSAFPKTPVVGCSTSGEIHPDGVCDDSAVLTLLHFEKTSVRIAQTSVSSAAESHAAGRRLIEMLPPAGLRHVMIFSDGLIVNGSDLLAGVAEVLPDGVSTSGGCAADGNRFSRTLTWCDSEPTPGMICAVGLYGDNIRIGVSATGGWGPFGPDRLITRSRKNVLLEVDGRPALALYKEYLGEYASQLPSIGLMFPLELRDANSDHRVLRALIATNEAEQSITFAGNVPEGWFCRFMVGDMEDLISGTHSAARQSLGSGMIRPPDFSLIVSCNGRRAVLKQRVDEEIDAAREVLGLTTAVAGFYSYGEIASNGFVNCSELHNETMSITSFTEE